MFDKKACMKEYNKKYYEMKKQDLNWIMQNRERVKKWRLEHLHQAYLQKVKYHHRVRQKIIDLLGGKCVRCGINDWRVLCVDHINGNGRKERKQFINPTTGNFKGKQYNLYLLKKIREGSKDYQLLCANCNQIKKYENREGIKYNERGEEICL